MTKSEHDLEQVQPKFDLQTQTYLQDVANASALIGALENELRAALLSNQVLPMPTSPSAPPRITLIAIRC